MWRHGRCPQHSSQSNLHVNFFSLDLCRDICATAPLEISRRDSCNQYAQYPATVYKLHSTSFKTQPRSRFFSESSAVAGVISQRHLYVPTAQLAVEFARDFFCPEQILQQGKPRILCPHQDTYVHTPHGSVHARDCVSAYMIARHTYAGLPASVPVADFCYSLQGPVRTSHVRAFTHPCTHMRMPTQSRTTDGCMQARTHAGTHARTHAQMHEHTQHEHAHARTTRQQKCRHADAQAHMNACAQAHR